MLSGVTTYTAREAADRSGVNMETLRYYERVGLFSTERTTGNHRRFGDDDLGWIEVLRCLRLAGMPIRDMQRFADLVRLDGSGTAAAVERLRLLQDQEQSLIAQIDELTAALSVVRRKITAYRKLED